MQRRALAALVAVVALFGWSGAASAQTGPQRFVLYQGPDDENFTVYASGPISGVGTDYLLDEGVDPAGRTQRMTETVFPEGSTFNTSRSRGTRSSSTRARAWRRSPGAPTWTSPAAAEPTRV